MDIPLPSPKALGYLGYIGLFLGVFLSNLSVIFPLPSILYISYAIVHGYNPLVVLFLSSLAAALGESSGYLLGLGGSYVARKVLKKYKDYRAQFKKNGFLFLVFVSAVPYLSGDVAGILAGAFRYDFKKFLVAVFLGRIIKYGVVILLVKLGINIWG